MAKSNLIFKLKYAAIFIALCLVNQIKAQGIDTLTTLSLAMNKQVKSVVISPENYSSTGDKKYPVLYLLHGYGGTFDSWLNRIKPELKTLSTSLQIIIVCPNGENSWYWDSPLDPTSKYETFVAKELPQAIDNKYNTITTRSGRAITGLSMGGHGALWLAFRHPDVYGACGSMSGGVDIRPFPNNWEMKKQLGTYNENRVQWDDHTVINQTSRITPSQLAIIIDCGTEDFFYDVNVALHKKLLDSNIPHDFISRPGAHNEAYWSNSIDYQLIFFKNFFTVAERATGVKK